MKIGIITSGVDMLVLFRFLANYNFEYEIVIDDLTWPWSDNKPLEYVADRAIKSMAYLTQQGCEKIIVPPVLEVALDHRQKCHEQMLPLRNEYVQACLSESPVGNIGFAAEYLDMNCHALIQNRLLDTYKPTEKQRERVTALQKKKPDHKRTLHFRWHEIAMWKYYLTKLSFKSQVVHHAMKADWRYFKDAMVDTIIPMSYGFFAYEVALRKFLNTKKQRFHGLDRIEDAFKKIIVHNDLTQQSYGVHIHHTGTLDLLSREKKRMRMLQKGKEVEVKTTQISL